MSPSFWRDRHVFYDERRTMATKVAALDTPSVFAILNTINPPRASLQVRGDFI